jgi:hypothetical protein
MANSQGTFAVHQFRRPVSRVLVDLLGAPIGAVLFLGFALLLLVGVVPMDGADPVSALLFRILGPLVFGFFGLLMATGVPTLLRRGLQRTVLRIGPEGIWTPEMGQLAWSAIGEVRQESMRSFPGDEGASSTVSYGRLGIVPVDPARSIAVRRSLAWRMIGAFMDLVRRMRPGIDVPDMETLAPFGVYEYEIEGPLAAAFASVERFRPVIRTTAGQATTSGAVHPPDLSGS